MNKILKKSFILASIAIITSPFHVFAAPGEWSSNGNIIYYTDGNVGIGKSSPTTKLDVVGNIQSRQTVNGGATFVVEPSNGTSQRFGMASVSTEGLYFGRTSGVSQGVQQDLFIRNNGGVGAKAPSDGGSTLVIIPNNGTSQRYGFSAMNDNGLYFGRTNNIGGGIHTDMYIGGNGNIGIGTTTTTSKLNVNGTIRAKEIVVTNSGWADYVFEDDYKLIPLDEVETFIKENKHLPGIKPGNEIEEQGQDIGQLQTKQMEKIEELTLYIIQQDKDIKALKETNLELLKRLEKLEALILK